MISLFSEPEGRRGKTTLSIHLADGLARRRSRVLLIDADPQQTAMKCPPSRLGKHGFSVVAMATPTLHKELPPIAADYTDIVIDGPPRIHNLAKSIILAADLVLIPVQPSPADVWATAETVDLVTEAQSFKETIKAVIVINRKIGNTVIGRDVRDALATLNTPILQADISQRVAFAEAFAAGKTVADLDPRGRAAQERRTRHHRTCEGLGP